MTRHDSTNWLHATIGILAIGFIALAIVAVLALGWSCIDHQKNGDSSSRYQAFSGVAE